MPFRKAHEAVGALVADLTVQGRTLADVTAGELEAAHAQLVPGDLDAITVAASVKVRDTEGGGSMESVRAQLERIRVQLGG